MTDAAQVAPWWRPAADLRPDRHPGEQCGRLGRGRRRRAFRGSFDAQIDYNLKSAFLACKYVIPLMIAQGGGAIVNMASASGIRWTGAPQVGYASSKAAVIQFSRVTAVEYAGQGIRVNTVVPGQMHTPMVEARLANSALAATSTALLKRGSRASRSASWAMGATLPLRSVPRLRRGALHHRHGDRGRWRHDGAVRLIICLRKKLQPMDHPLRRPHADHSAAGSESEEAAHHAAAARVRFAFSRVRAAQHISAIAPERGRSRRPTRPRRICSACTPSSASSAASSCNRRVTAAINRALVDLLDAGKGRYRGVALLEPSMPEAEVERLDDAGVRGVRLHFYFPHGGAAGAARGYAPDDREGRAARLAYRHSCRRRRHSGATTNSLRRSMRRS